MTTIFSKLYSSRELANTLGFSGKFDFEVYFRKLGVIDKKMGIVCPNINWTGLGLFAGYSLNGTLLWTEKGRSIAAILSRN